MSAPAVHASPHDTDAVLSVFFCGTDGNLADPRTLIEYFYRWTVADELDQHTRNDDEMSVIVTDRPARTHLKLAFDGCGTAFGAMGVLFASGLQQQVAVAVAHIRKLLQKIPPLTALHVNVVGLSRGACAAMFLAQHLSSFDSMRLHLNLCLFDPVPGNLIATSDLDCCLMTTANQATDLRACAPLRRVLALYPHEPLPDLAFHAPLMGQYPSLCQVEEDVFLGCHQGALWSSPHNLACQLSFACIRDFLNACGTALNEVAMLSLFKFNDEALLNRLNAEMHARREYLDSNTNIDPTQPLSSQSAHVTQRVAHSEVDTMIVRDLPLQELSTYVSDAESVYLNHYHARLAKKFQQHKSSSDAPEHLLLRIERGASRFGVRYTLRVLVLAVLLALVLGLTLGLRK